MLNAELIALLQAQPQDLEVDIEVPVYDGDWEGVEVKAAQLVYIDPKTNKVTISA